MPATRSINVTKDGIDKLTFLANILLEEQLTEREIDILKVIIELKLTQLYEVPRKLVCTRLDISRENLNNILGRMRLKKVFDKEWNLSPNLLPLINYNEIGKAVITLPA